MNKELESYTCHKCREHHTTENMVAYCASCVWDKDRKIRELEAALNFQRLASDSDCRTIAALRLEVRQLRSDLEVR